jgi:hypothetical protein
MKNILQVIWMYRSFMRVYYIFTLLWFLLNYLNAQPPLLSIQQQKAGWFEIRGDTLKGNEFIIESSADLKTWSPVFGSKGDVTVFPMLTTDIQNPCQFYRAKLKSPDISTVIISKTNSKPFGLLNINLGNVDVFNNEFSVIFYDNTGCHVKVNAIPLTNHVISVPVPPFFVLTDELSKGSELNIQIIAVSLDSKSYVSGVVKGFVVEPMDVTTNSPGLITLAYINGLKLYSEYLLTAVITNDNLQKLSVGLFNLMYGLSQLKTNIQQVIDYSNDVAVGTIGNQPIIINRQVLQTLDKEIISILKSQGEAIRSSGASTSVFSGQIKAANSDVQTAADNYINALLHNPDTAANAAIEYYNAYSKASVDAVSTGLKVTAGSAGLGISFASLAGVPAAALAMANSALLYVTGEASMGLIAISGILGQSNTMSQIALKRGVEQLNSILIGPIKELLLGKTAGEILSIINNVSSLKDIFLMTDFLEGTLFISPSDIYLGEIGLNPKTTSFMINAPDSVSWNIEVFGWGTYMDYELSSYMGSGSQQVSVTLRPTPPAWITYVYDPDCAAFIYCSFYYDGEMIDEKYVTIWYDYIFER